MHSSVSVKLSFVAAIIFLAKAAKTEDANLDSATNRAPLPLFLRRGCMIRTKSGSVIASCFSNELCRYTCVCHGLLKDRFSIICGPRPPFYTGVINRVRVVLRLRGALFMEPRVAFAVVNSAVLSGKGMTF